jgi:PadR family transcriptional regulator
MRPKRSRPEQPDVLQGTLDMLVLQSLLLGAAHGYTIVRLIQQRSDDQLQVGQGSLYPALHRLEGRKWIASFWGTSENNRRARYYRLTPAGRRQLADETGRWQQLVRAVGRVLRPVDEG